jgi:type I restriction enzyme S subunit
MMEKQTKIGTIPEGWKVKKLKEVFHINELSLPSNTDANYKFKYIPIEFVSTNHIDYGNCESFRFVDAPGRARRIVRENDILISGVRPNLKSFAVFKKPDDSNWICSTGFYVLTAKEESDNLFSYYELLSEIGESQFYSYVAGSNYPAIGDGDIRNMKLMFPKDKSEQSAIAAILSKVDEAIATVQASISAAERLKKSLMQNLLTGRMKPDGTLRKEDEFYVDEKFGKVPVGWEVKRIDEIADFVQYGLNQASSETGNIPMFRMNNIVNGEMQNYPLVYVNLNETALCQYKLEKGDILFNRTNSMDLVGKVGVFKLDGDYVFASYLIRIRVSKDNNPYFVNYALNSYPIQCSLRSKATPAVSQANINSKSLRNTSIIIPTNKKEQDEIVSRINNVENEIINKQNKIVVLERLKKSLMQNLLTGKVSINK